MYEDMKLRMRERGKCMFCIVIARNFVDVQKGPEDCSNELNIPCSFLLHHVVHWQCFLLYFLFFIIPLPIIYGKSFECCELMWHVSMFEF